MTKKFAIQYWNTSQGIQFSSPHREGQRIYALDPNNKEHCDMKAFIADHSRSNSFASLFVGTKEEFDQMFPNID
jgi:hypothetical protein